MTAPDYVAKVAELLGQHRIECTGMEGVTCRACRDLGWMPMRTFAAHQAEVLATAGLIPTRNEWGVAGRGVTSYSEGFTRFMASPEDRILTRAVTDWKDASDD